MALLVQITDTHIQPKGQLLYGQVDAALHLRNSVEEIARIRPIPDLVVITGDLVEKPDRESYEHFKELIAPIQVPVYVLPGNHDDPVLMAEMFADTGAFPVTDATNQYAVEVNSFRMLALNSHIGGSELPEFDGEHLDWLVRELPKSDKPTMIAIHHPPMKTGIEFIDMGGTQWFQELKEVLSGRHNVHLVICGHCHTDMSGRIGSVPVYMCGSVAHQLIAARGMDIAPSFVAEPVPPVLHHFIEDHFVSGSYPWPLTTEENRIDKQSGIPWETLKKQMMGSKAP